MKVNLIIAMLIAGTINSMSYSAAPAATDNCYSMIYKAKYGSEKKSISVINKLSNVTPITPIIFTKEPHQNIEGFATKSKTMNHVFTDPDPGQAKTLSIDYTRYCGRMSQLKTKQFAEPTENQQIILPNDLD